MRWRIAVHVHGTASYDRFMWIVRLALNRPYTFIVLAALILILGPVAILNTPTDIFPNINIPVVAVAWTYTGLNAEDVETRLTTPYEKVLTTLVDNIQHIESTSYNGEAIVKIFLQPGASLDTANAQVVAAGGFVQRFLPTGIQPPEIINFSASSVPILQLGLSGEGMSEQQLNDLALNFLRTELITVPGVVIPLPYGGKQRQVMINMNQNLMQAKGVSPSDVLNAVNAQNLILPSGTAKVAESELDVRMNVYPRTVPELNNIPIKQVGNTTIYLREVATVSDGFAVQTNVVRQDGNRGVLMSILKAGNASTLDVVSGIRKLLPRAASTLPPELKITPLADQSVFVRGAISGVVREALIAGCLTGVMILLFIGSWRSTIIIAISIPLSILSSILTLSALHETINIMTLGGLALAVGILVDDATVEIENINRNLAMGKETVQAILDGAQQIAVPAFVSTLCLCIVFLPMFFLSGVAKYLFVPLAEAVSFAMLASYMWSRTIVPTMAMYLLSSEDEYIPEEHRGEKQGFFRRMQQRFEHRFEQSRNAYRRALGAALDSSIVFSSCFLIFCLLSGCLLFVLGRDFFPKVDAGQIRMHFRARTGLRIEETARLADQIDAAIRQTIPANELQTILDNLGVPYSGINLSYSNSGTFGTSDGEILMQLNEKHGPTADYINELARSEE